MLISINDWEEMTGEGAEAPQQEDSQPVTAATVQPKERRTNKIVPGTDEPSDLEEEDRSSEVGSRGRRISVEVAPWEEEEEDAAEDAGGAGRR